MVSRVSIVLPFFNTLSLVAILHLWRLCGVLHEICNRSDLEFAKREFIIIMANLFGPPENDNCVEKLLVSIGTTFILRILLRAWENLFHCPVLADLRCFRVYPLPILFISIYPVLFHC